MGHELDNIMICRRTPLLVDSIKNPLNMLKVWLNYTKKSKMNKSDWSLHVILLSSDLVIVIVVGLVIPLSPTIRSKEQQRGRKSQLPER